jgi:hypothetical protein
MFFFILFSVIQRLMCKKGKEPKKRENDKVDKKASEKRRKKKIKRQKMK